MDTGKNMASETVAPVSKARIVAPVKPTSAVCTKSIGGASAFLEPPAAKAVRQSLRAAIDAMCRSCLYDPGNGTGGWREQVQGCSSSNCALHAVRPLPVRAIKTSKDERPPLLCVAGANEGPDSLCAPIVGHNDVISNVGRAA